MSDQQSTNSSDRPGHKPLPFRALRRVGDKVRVLIVDDSAVVRKILSTELAKDPALEVVGVAANPFVARDLIVQKNPDVLTLDVEMPRMDGLSFLQKLMTHYPLPVVMFSSLTEASCELTLKALEAGAVDVMLKPSLDLKAGLRNCMRELAHKIKVASRARLVKRELKPSATKVRPATAMIRTTEKVVAVGASTGGTQALAHVMERMPANGPAMVIVQHMPAKFTKSFADRLNNLSAMEVREARENDTVHQGLALLAPGDYHMLFHRSGARYYVTLNQGPPVHHQRPAVEVLFHSVSKYAGSNAVGVIMTGMGSDGAEGLLKMQQAGAHTIAQDEASCVVFGMPKEAIDKGGVDRILPLDRIHKGILDAVA